MGARAMNFCISIPSQIKLNRELQQLLMDLTAAGAAASTGRSFRVIVETNNRGCM
jgi:hypothetical protein